VLQKVRAAKPNFSVETVRRTAPMNASMMELFVEELCEAGSPVDRKKIAAIALVVDYFFRY
jgi:hypothetical protein